jgi:lipid A 4'-phosphatase
MDQSFYRNTLFLDWAIPLILLAIIAPFTPEIDLALARYFYDPVQKSFSNHPFFSFFYDWGVLAGQIFGIAALCIFLLSFLVQRIAKWRRPALYIGLTIAIGAGLITHAVFKDHWKRPRPKQVEEFGGTEAFRAFYQPNLTAEGNFKSFVSGHATMGFCFFALAILGRRYGNKRLFYAGLFLALALGGGLSLTRIAQGGHFFSDTLAAACLMWITAATCDWWLMRSSKTQV